MDTVKVEPKNEHWVVDKKIPLALIGTMLFQFGVGVWYVRGLDHRVETLETYKVRAETVEKVRDQQIQTVELKLARIEERQTSMFDLTKELKVAIDKLVERRQ